MRHAITSILLSMTILSSLTFGFSVQESWASRKVYWVESSPERIRRANLDGTEREDIVTGLGQVSGIALDIASGKIYWADSGSGGLQRANLDGSHMETLVPRVQVVSIVLDNNAGKVYWTEPRRIRRANLDGTGVEDLVSFDATVPLRLWGITLDIITRKIYWTSQATDTHMGKLQRSNFDGTNIEDLVSTEMPRGLTLDIAHDKVYWTNEVDGIQRANLDGNDVEQIVAGATAAQFLTLDVDSGKIYWTDLTNGSVLRAYLNGNNVEPVVIGLDTPSGLALALDPVDTTTLYPGPRYHVGGYFSSPNGVAIGDFNADGAPDIVTANYGPSRRLPLYDGTISVLVNKGDGTFQAAQDYTVSVHATDVAIGDFNADGAIDIVTVSWNVMSLLLGNGDATFQPAQVIVPGRGYEFVAVADVNTDGAFDIIATATRSVTVLLGKGDGTFQPPQLFEIACSIVGSLKVTDINTDGVLDILTSFCSPTSGNNGSHIGILLGKGDGTFQQEQSLDLDTLGVEAFNVKVNDLNADGVPDIIANGRIVPRGPTGVVVLLGNGDGTFQNGYLVDSIRGGHLFAVSDVTADGRLDLIVSLHLSQRTPGQDAAVLEGNGDGTFQLLDSFLINGGTSVVNITISDLNSDETSDLVIQNWSASNITILLGHRDGTFDGPIGFDDMVPRRPGDGPSFNVAVDLNGDGVLDLLSRSSSFLGNGNGTFRRVSDVIVPKLFSNSDLVVRDYNADGRLDLVSTAINVGDAGNPDDDVIGLVILPGSGDGTFQTAQFITRDSWPVSSGPRYGDIEPGDLNGDGFLDLIAIIDPSREMPKSVAVFLGNGDGTFQAAQFSTVDPCAQCGGPNSVLIVDINSDGALDVVAGGENTQLGPNLYIFLGNGDGTLRPVDPVIVKGVNVPIAFIDLNADGYPDLVAVGKLGISLLLGNGDGSFQAEQIIAEGHGWRPPTVIADVNADGINDLVISSSGRVSVLLGNGDGTFQVARAFNTTSGHILVVDDFNGDEAPDIFTRLSLLLHR